MRECSTGEHRALDLIVLADAWELAYAQDGHALLFWTIAAHPTADGQPVQNCLRARPG
jgi:hypothetical protein